MGSEAVQRRPKVVQAGEGMRLNVQGCPFFSRSDFSFSGSRIGKLSNGTGC